MANRLRAAVYVRVSKKKLQTVLNQFKAIRKAAAYLDIDIVRVYKDRRTGRNQKRAGLTQLKHDLFKQRRGYDVLMVWSISRLGRNTLEMSEFLVKVIKPSGIRLYSHKEQIDTNTAAGQLIYNIMAAIYEFEVEHTIEKIHSGLDRARAQGKKLGRKLAPDERLEEIGTLRAQGLPYNKIAQQVGCSNRLIQRALEVVK